MRQTLSILVENSPGVLARVAGLFGRRGYNIHSLAVGVTEDPSLSRMTIVVDGDTRTVEQVSKQLNKLINVLRVSEADASVCRELALIKIHCEPDRRPAVMQVADIFRARVVDVSRNGLVLEITGDAGKVDALLEMAREFGIKEVVRTGAVAISRGASASRTKRGVDDQ